MLTFVDFVRAFVLMLVRNRQALFWTFLFPVLLMGLLGIVFGRGFAGSFGVAVVDEDRGTVARAVVAALRGADGVAVVLVPSEADALSRLRDGEVQGVLVLPAGLDARFARGGATVRLPFHYDDSEVATAGQVLGLTQQVVQSVGDRLSGRAPRLGIAPRGVAAADLGYLDFLVPGIVALSIMQSAIFGVGGTLVTYKERHVLRRLRATPLPMRSFMAANVVVRVLTSLAQTAVIIAVGMLLFDVRLHGSPVLLSGVAVLGSLCFVSLGFTIAAVSPNMEVAQALMNVVQTPMMFLSGIFFPMNDAPAWIQPVVKVLPLTYLADALRQVAIDGAGFWAVRADLLVLLAVTAAFVGVAWRTFRWG